MKHTSIRRFCETVDAGDVEAVRKMLGKDPSLARQRDSALDEEAIHTAAWHDHVDIVKLLLDAGADIEALDSHGRTPLQVACKEVKSEVVKLLVQLGADINAVDDHGYSALCLALVEATPEAARNAKLLIDHGCVVDIESAIRLGSVERLRHAIESYEAPIREHPQSEEFLECAIVDGASRCTGATKQARNKIRKKTIEMITLLIDAGVNPNLRSAGGSTPLIAAIESPELGTGVIKCLTEQGAKVNVADFVGRTPLQIAKLYKSTAAVRLLKKHGAKE